jgi:hypothetical protein
LQACKQGIEKYCDVDLSKIFQYEKNTLPFNLGQKRKHVQPLLDVDDAKDRVADLTNPLSNSISEKISRIKSKMKNMLGEEIASSYVISGPNGGLKKIEVDRSLVTEIT